MLMLKPMLNHALENHVPDTALAMSIVEPKCRVHEIFCYLRHIKAPGDIVFTLNMCSLVSIIQGLSNMIIKGRKVRDKQKPV